MRSCFSLFSLLSFILTILLVSHTAMGQQPVTLPNSEQFALKSDEGLEYRILISQSPGKTPADGHGVVYVLDGGDNFAIMAKLAERHGRYASARDRDDGLIVVGIDYPNAEEADRTRRIYDFTPPTAEDMQKRHPKFPPTKTGGQAAFLKFIQDKVKPEVSKRFTINPKRQAIWGHSLGGLFVLHVLFTQPDTFQAYGSASPSIWWNGMSILEEEKAFTKKGGSKVDIVLMAGGREAPHMAVDTRHMARRLELLNANGLGVYAIEFPDDDHGTVVAPSLNRFLVYLTEYAPR